MTQEDMERCERGHMSEGLGGQNPKPQEDGLPFIALDRKPRRTRAQWCFIQFCQKHLSHPKIYIIYQLRN